MQTRAQDRRAASSGAAKTVNTRQPVPAGDAVELDYAPKRMTARETWIVSLKLALAAAAVFALLWLAHVKLER